MKAWAAAAYGLGRPWGGKGMVERLLIALSGIALAVLAMDIFFNLYQAIVR